MPVVPQSSPGLLDELQTGLPPSYDQEPQYDEPQESDYLLSSAAALPQYASGSSVECVPTDEVNIYEAVVRVHVDEPLAPRSSFGTGDLISGSIVVVPKKDGIMDALVVDLYGEEISVKVHSYTDSHYKRIFSLANYHMPAEALPADSMLLKGFRYTFSYSIVVPDEVPSRGCPCGTALHSALPPSYGSSFESLLSAPDEVAGCKAKMLYRVRARIYAPGATDVTDVWARGSRTVIMRPSSYPPADLRAIVDSTGMALLADSYWSSKRLTHGLVRKTTIGTVLLTIRDELKVLLYNPAPCMVGLEVKFTPQNGSNANALTITGISYSVNSLTFTSSKATPAAPSRHSVEAAGSKSDVSIVTDLIGKQKLASCHTAWRLESDGTYVADLRLPFSFPVSSNKVVETYFSCLTSRQYEFVVTITYGKGFGTQTLRVPIVVSNYRARRRSRMSLGEMASGEATEAANESVPRAPGYIESNSSTASVSSFSTPQDWTPQTRQTEFDLLGGRRRQGRLSKAYDIAAAQLTLL